MADNSTPTDINPIVKEAMERFDRAQKWESNARKNWLSDYKFANADAVNGYQWPDELRRNRDLDARPCLTINKTRQHCLQIMNDARQNKPAIKIRGTGNGASAQSAQAYNALTRHIEYRSKASTYYDQATGFQVQGGVGYLRVITDYVSEDTFDQEALIQGIPNPLMVYTDPDAKEPDKSDMMFAFIFEDVQKKEFDLKYPEFKEAVKAAGTDSIGDEYGWMREDYIRVAEYYRVVLEKDILYTYPGPDGKAEYMKKSAFKGAKELLQEFLLTPQLRERDILTRKVEWHFIIGRQKVDSKDWVGRYIPIVPVIGEETIIDGVMDRKGHARALRDPQRMYNYWSSAAVEYGALQSKSPYIAAAEAVEGYENMWNNANKANYSVLLYNALSDAGEKIEPPHRQEPPVASPVALQGMQVAQQEMALVSGQYGPNMGQPGNERTGKALNERQRMGDNATYHFVDNLAISVRGIGRILVDIIPKVYDTPRILKIMDEDGTELELMIDPRQQQAYQQQLGIDGKVAQHLLNPSVGLYEVEADVGPDYGTKRQESVEAFKLILTQAPQLTNLIGDLLLQASDFNLAAQAAQRLRRMVPPQALGEGPTQTEQMLTQQNQQLTGMMKEMMEDLTEQKMKVRDHAVKRDVDIYNALTTRLKVFFDAKAKEAAEISPEEVQTVLTQAIHEALGASLQDAEATAGAQEQSLSVPRMGQEAPVPMRMPPGVRMGADSHEYMRDYANMPNYRPVA